MTKFSRRQFVRTSSLAMCSVAAMGISCDRKKRAFRYALCSESVKDFPWEEQCRIIGEAGFDGVEIAPFTLVKEGVREITPSQREGMVQAMKDAGIVCAGLHWLFVPPPQGLHFTTPDKQIRMRSVEYLDRLIDFCGDMGGKAMIFGSPAQRGTSAGQSLAEAIGYFIEGLTSVADHARDRDVSILIESLGKSQTDVINTLAESVALARQIDHPNIATMFDYHNTENETEPLPSLILKYGSDIRHVHVQNMDGTLIRPGNVPGEIVEVFRNLEKINYKNWVSIEVFDFTPGGKTIATEGMKALAEAESRM